MHIYIYCRRRTHECRVASDWKESERERERAVSELYGRVLTESLRQWVASAQRLVQPPVLSSVRPAPRPTPQPIPALNDITPRAPLLYSPRITILPLFRFVKRMPLFVLTFFKLLLHLVSVVFTVIRISVWFDKSSYYMALFPCIIFHGFELYGKER